MRPKRRHKYLWIANARILHWNRAAHCLIQLKILELSEKHSDELYIIFFIYYKRLVCCKHHELHFYLHDIRDQNINLPLDIKCKNFALNCGASCSTEFKIYMLSGKHSDDFYIIFVVYCSRFPCCKDRGLHLYMHDRWGENVNLPIDSKCKNFALKLCCALLDSF